MPRSTTLAEVLGTAIAPDAPHVHHNHEGAIVAVMYTSEGWDAVDAARKSEYRGQRSVAIRCPVRGLVSVDAFVTPAATASATAPKPWTRAERAAYAFAEAA